MIKTFDSYYNCKICNNNINVTSHLKQMEHSNMNKERLLKVANYLLKLKPTAEKAFDMSLWKREKECGFVGCAIGHTAHLFENEGFRMGQDQFKLIPKLLTYDNYFIPQYQEASGMDALRLFFDLDFNEAKYLFTSSTNLDPSKYQPRLVGQRILDFISEEKNKCL